MLKKNYLKNYVNYLKNLENRKIIKILDIKRIGGVVTQETPIFYCVETIVDL